MVITPKTPPMSPHSASSTALAASPPAPAGALFTASSSVSGRLCSPYFTRRFWNRLKYTGMFAQSAIA